MVTASPGSAASGTSSTHPASSRSGPPISNGDHHLDLVVGTSSASAKFSVLLGDGHGGFGAATDYPLPNVSGSGYYVAIGDVSGDGILDVVVSGGNVPGVSVLLGLGNGSLGPRLDVASSGSVSAIACADLNNDQLADVVFVGNNTLSIVLSVGDGYFDPKIDFPYPFLRPPRSAISTVTRGPTSCAARARAPWFSCSRTPMGRSVRR